MRPSVGLVGMALPTDAPLASTVAGMTAMKRPPGRPPLDAKSAEPSADVHLTLAAADYDQAEQHAKSRRESLQDLIRRGIKRIIADERG